MTTFFIIAAILGGLILLMLTVLATLLLQLHRSAIPAELACCPHTQEEDALWEGSA